MTTQPHAGAAVPPFPGLASVLPERIDRYRIIRVLGEGGMGVVYLAEQDEPVQREVAIKVLRAGTDSAEVVARFASERQALALMDHPSITRVYDAGLTADCLPYFVMERVEGVPINEHAAAHRLTTRQRAALFVQVCRAVQHAHQKGIIHRDLKPSNVLVADGDGAPLCKVIDFGIAKATGPSLPGSRLTATGMAIGTPAYMSPEQFLGHGDDVDTRSDIYSLGVLLYELLAGALPGTSGDTPSWGALLRRAEGDMPSASAQFAALSPETRQLYAAERGTDPEELRRSLRGDLDCILAKALDLDRERRYPTAAAFADDLERFLADQPILARGASRAYRVRKFARRHRAGVVLASLLFAVLVATAIGATVQARRLEVARSIAVSRQQQGDSLITFMLGDLSTKLRPIGRLDVLEKVNGKLLAYYAAVPTATLSDPERLGRAESLRQLGSIRQEQGHMDEASALLGQSLAIARDVAIRDTSNARPQMQLAHSAYESGSLAWQQGQTDSALRHFETFLHVSERLVARFPDSLQFRAERAYALNNVGIAHERKGDAASALRAYRTADSVIVALLAVSPEKMEWNIAHGGFLNAIAEAQRKLGDIAGSLANHEEELRVRSRVLSSDPTDAGQLRFVAIAHVYVGDAQLWAGRVAAGLAELREARRIYGKLAARDTVNPTIRLSEAGAWRRIAQALIEQDNATAALAATTEAQATYRSFTNAFAATDRAARDAAVLGATTARALLLGGRAAEARSSAQHAVAALDSGLVRRPDDLERRKGVIEASLTLGDALRTLGDSAGARAAWTRALDRATVAAPLSRETDFLMLRTAPLLRLGRDREAAADCAELIRRGVRRPSFIALLHAHGLPTGS